MSIATVINGDARRLPLADGSVHMVCTSPPYFQLRDYGTATWEGGSEGCDHGEAYRAKRQAGRQSDVEGGVPGSLRDKPVTACKCGARRVDRQIGLEATPDQYVAAMVAVFREVKRVLRDDGCLWLNLGDSFGPGKQLLGMPWRVARALQEPYYSGSIKDERDRIWLAAMIDAEGCMFLHRRKSGQHNGQGYLRKIDGYGAGLEVANTHESIVNRCLAITGRGSVCRQDKDRRQPLYRWNLRSNECRDVIREIYPHLVGKQHQARLLLGCPSSGQKAEDAHRDLIRLHNGFSVETDFPAPESMFEPGWILRSDCIWSKLNPMPESVTDRPTKSHEYVFLLAKQERYYWDQEAVKEKQTGDLRPRAAKEFPKSFEHGKGVKANASFHRAVQSHVDLGGRNIRSVWSIPIESFPGAHFATYPRALVERCVKAGTSERGCCPECGAPWERVVEVERVKHANTPGRGGRQNTPGSETSPTSCFRTGLVPVSTTLGWRPTCKCVRHVETFEDGSDSVRVGFAYEPVPATVLDPFVGSGTTGVVATGLGRRFVGVDLSPDYCRMAVRRISRPHASHRTARKEESHPLFARVAE